MTKACIWGNNQHFYMTEDTDTLLVMAHRMFTAKESQLAHWLISWKLVVLVVKCTCTLITWAAVSHFRTNRGVYIYLTSTQEYVNVLPAKICPRADGVAKVWGGSKHSLILTNCKQSLKVI